MKYHRFSLSGDFFRAGLITFGVGGVLDWLLAMASTSGLVPKSAALGLLLFLSQWCVGGALWWALLSAVFWLARGNPAPTPLIEKAIKKLRQIWHERHQKEDRERLAKVLAASTGALLFAAGSIFFTSHLIATRHGPALIALTSLIGQVFIALGCIWGALTLRRGIRPLLRRRPRFFHTPFVLTLGLLSALLLFFGAIIIQRELFLALEGPSILLLGAALFSQPFVAYGLSRSRPPGVLLRRGLWLLPLLAMLIGSAAAQNNAAKRLLVLHGQVARFSFHIQQQYIPVDRLFKRGHCDPFGDDPSACLDPKWENLLERPSEATPFERPELEEKPSFLLITWDSVRADRLSFMGHERDTTPNLAEFATKSAVFERAFSADSGTGPSFWSLVSGKTPFQVQLHDAHRFPPQIDESEELLAEILQESGYQTSAIFCAEVFTRPRWSSMWRGIERFEEVCGKRRRGLAPRTTAAALKEFKNLSSDDEPFFLWVHYYDPHHPYEKYPEIDFGDEAIDRYDEELHYTDKHIQPLLDAALSSKRPIYTIFAADHGENFNEHGRDPHARNLYRIVTQVPKIIHGPGVDPARIQAPVALNDIYPTILDLAQIAIPEATTMHSQTPVLFGAQPNPHRMIFQENSYSRPRRHTKAVVYDRFHFMIDLTSRTEELYDYVADPLERKNLIGAGLNEEELLRQAMLRFLETTEIPPGLQD